jgi:hypothetical protein
MLALISTSDHSFETRPGPAGRPRAGLTTKRGEKKPGVTRQDPVINPLIFVFFLLKRRRFDFFLKELTRPTWSNPMTRPKSRTRALDQAGS